MDKQKKQKKAKEGIDPELTKKLEGVFLETDKVKGETLFFNDSGGIDVENTIENILKEVSAIDDPDKKYDIYYNGIEKLLRDNLPKGSDNAKARELVREEKCVYLSRGKRKNEKGIRHGDSRMTYIEDAQEMYKMVLTWASSGANMVDLYNTLRQVNIDKGYGKRVHY